MNSWPSLIFSAVGLLAASEVANALTAVDPGPYTAATGYFPLWYKDQNELSLELCQSRAISTRVAATVPPSYMCLLNAEQGVYDDGLPMVFPDNFPSEAFWFTAETSIPAVGNSGYELEVYVAALEAAFSAGPPNNGDQQSFARIRIRAAVPTPGTYTVTHPYGVETVVVPAGGTGRRAINITRDIGIGAPGNFNGALDGNIGPFLRSINGPYTAINPDTGTTETFIGDPNVAEPVTGSPNGTNFVRVEGPAGTIISNTFSVTGKILDARVQTPVSVKRSTYSRNGSGTRIELFASSPNTSSLCYRETLALVPGTPPSACQFNLLSDNNGYFFSHRPATAGLPPFVVLTASSQTNSTKPTPVSSKLVDVVKIRTARYSWDNHTLVLEATSSDETSPPDLVAQGFGRLAKSGLVQQLSISDLTQPPAFVTVKSAAGGSDTEPVIVVGTAPNTGANQPPVVANDTGNTGFGVPVTLSVLSNDSDPDGDVPLTISDLTQPATGLGTVALNGTTSIVYTPPPVVTTPIQAVFTYKAVDSKGLKSASAATVTVGVAPNRPPVAANDTAATLAGAPLTLNVLANDTDPEGNVPLSVTNLTQPAVNRGTVTTNGTSVVYTPPATVTTAFTATFTYQAADSFGALSTPATVNVQVSAPPANQEALTITTATVQVRAGRFSWDVSGTSSVITGNTITVTVNTPNGPVVLDSVAVPVTGRWRVSVVNAVAPAATNPTATARSSVGTVRTLPITVR